jgi:hypothetical protein
MRMALTYADAAGAEPDEAFRTARPVHDLLAASAVASPLAGSSWKAIATRLAYAGQKRVIFAGSSLSCTWAARVFRAAFFFGPKANPGPPGEESRGRAATLQALGEIHNLAARLFYADCAQVRRNFYWRKSKPRLTGRREPGVAPLERPSRWGCHLAV